MKIALLAIAIILTMPVVLFAEKDKNVPIEVPKDSGVSLEVTAMPVGDQGTFSFKITNSNSYPVRVSGKYMRGSSWGEFDEKVKANGSTVAIGNAAKGSPLGKIVVEKVEKEK